ARRSGRLSASAASLLALGALVCGSCSSVAPPTETARPASAAAPADAGVVPELFIDASAAAGGDGSRARPFRSLADAPAHGRLRLASGIYPGGVLLEDVVLIGGPAVVLAAAPPVPCIRSRGRVRLEQVQIQGGSAGVVVESGRATLASVSLSGQRGPGLEVGPGAEVVVTGSTFQASVSSFPGVRVLPGGKAELAQVRFQGPFRRAVDASQPAALRLSGVQAQDAVTGLWLSGGAALVESMEVRGGRGPGIYVAGGTLQLRDVRVGGHEYGLLTGEGARVDGRGLRSTGAERAGVALVKSKGTLEDVHVESAGSMGGVQLIASEVRIRGLEVQGGRSSGLVTRDAQLTLEGGTLRGPRTTDLAEGNAVQIRGGRATLGGLRIQDCSGIGVLAAEGASVTIARTTVSGAAVAGLAAETEASLSATEVSIERTAGPAVLVTEHGTARLRSMTARGNRDGPLWAECSQGVDVEIDGWAGDASPVPTPCVHGAWAITPRR
ncbi:MAG TPA: right-handed parallel beta-helix repeat-containing protein, partial [Myxococcaceae bacterium]|nr:right-handed parallel beta-helix repeat-containing protein [Myxococcaceae bacterium]